MPSSRVSSQPRNWTAVSSIAGRFFTSWVTREAPRDYNKSVSNVMPGIWRRGLGRLLRAWPGSNPWESSWKPHSLTHSLSHSRSNPSASCEKYHLFPNLTTSPHLLATALVQDSCPPAPALPTAIHPPCNSPGVLMKGKPNHFTSLLWTLQD